uniref:SEA domain-containing protein n=1 Tax=Rhabditophanes sp. KR3021 TaxID=114890 RepID=A0AC35TZF7_9BILA
MKATSIILLIYYLSNVCGGMKLPNEWQLLTTGMRQEITTTATSNFDLSGQKSTEDDFNLVSESKESTTTQSVPLDVLAITVADVNLFRDLTTLQITSSSQQPTTTANSNSFPGDVSMIKITHFITPTEQEKQDDNDLSPEKDDHQMIKQTNQSSDKSDVQFGVIHFPNHTAVTEQVDIKKDLGDIKKDFINSDKIVVTKVETTTIKAIELSFKSNPDVVTIPIQSTTIKTPEESFKSETIFPLLIETTQQPSTTTDVSLTTTTKLPSTTNDSPSTRTVITPSLSHILNSIEISPEVMGALVDNSKPSTILPPNSEKSANNQLAIEITTTLPKTNLSSSEEQPNMLEIFDSTLIKAKDALNGGGKEENEHHEVEFSIKFDSSLLPELKQKKEKDILMKVSEQVNPILNEMLTKLLTNNFLLLQLTHLKEDYVTLEGLVLTIHEISNLTELQLNINMLLTEQSFIIGGNKFEVNSATFEQTNNLKRKGKDMLKSWIDALSSDKSEDVIFCMLLICGILVAIIVLIVVIVLICKRYGEQRSMELNKTQHSINIATVEKGNVSESCSLKDNDDNMDGKKVDLYV